MSVGRALSAGHTERDAGDVPSPPTPPRVSLRVARDGHRFRAFLPRRGSQRLPQKRAPALALTPAPSLGTEPGASAPAAAHLLRLIRSSRERPLKGGAARSPEPSQPSAWRRDHQDLGSQEQ